MSQLLGNHSKVDSLSVMKVSIQMSANLNGLVTRSPLPMIFRSSSYLIRVLDEGD